MYPFYGNYFVYLCVYIVMGNCLCVYIAMCEYLCSVFIDLINNYNVFL